MSDRNFGFDDEGADSKLVRKAKESPFMIIGILGCVAACGMGAYGFKNKGKTSTSIYLMQLRVIAQGAVMGSLAVGIVYSMFNDYILPKPKK